GGVTISDVATAAFAYNATAFREADNYLYAIASNGQLVRIQDDGSAAQLGAVSISGGGSLAAMYSGAFGGGAYADTYFVRAANSTSLMYLVDVDARTATSRTLSEAVTSNDFTWAYGYLWGVQADKQVVRINPADGAVTKVAATALFPLDDASQTSGYGAAWTYGNGNLAFSNNFTGYITQLAVTNPGGSPFSVSRVSTIVGPSTSQNDGATTPSQPVDLVVSVSSPPAAAPNSPIAWTVTVTNDGPGGSSGAVVQFPVPPGVTGVVPPDGCTVAA
ncbi:MAG TPA: hypothetical protein PKB06_05430, partial [Actinotalea sp.]|nr:hypothetical protein [Actinotalea sp.]